MSGRVEIDFEVETEILRTALEPRAVYVRLFEVKTVASRKGMGETVTTTRTLVDGWTCRVGEGDFTTPIPDQHDHQED